MAAFHDRILWFVDFANYFASGLVPSDLSFHQREKFMHAVKKFCWVQHYLFCIYAYRIISRFVPEVEMIRIVEKCHSSPVGVHHSVIKTVHKILLFG